MSIGRLGEENDRAAPRIATGRRTDLRKQAGTMKRRDGTDRERRTKRPSTPGYVLIDSRPPNLLTRSRQHGGRSQRRVEPRAELKRDNADSPVDVELQK